MSTIDPKSVRIAFFHLAFLYSGGGEKLALKEVELLRQKGYLVDCYTPLLDEKECFPDLINKYEVKEIIKGFTKLWKNKPEIGVIVTVLLFPFISYRFKNYDLVIGANQPGPVFGYILKRLYKIPYIIYIAQPTRMIYTRKVDREHGYKLKNQIKWLPHFINILRPLFFWVDLKSIACADTFFCNGKYMQDILGNVYGRTPILCPAGAETSNTQATKDPLFTFRGVPIPKPFIFLSNRHFAHKKFEYALEALDLLKVKVPLLIAGKPTDYTDDLKKLVRYYKLEAYVHFLGYVTETELDELYTNCQVYVYTAPEEDFGMGIVEAMAYQKPVVAWNHAGPSRIISHQLNGFLAEPNRIDQFKEYIEYALGNSRQIRDIGLNAANTVKLEYSWENHISQFETYIQKNIAESQEQPALLTDTLSVLDINNNH